MSFEGIQRPKIRVQLDKRRSRTWCGNGVIGALIASEAVFVATQTRPQQPTKMKYCILASLLLSGAAAFAPASSSKSAAALEASSFKGEVGAQAPLGYFDPLNISEGWEQAEFDRLREVEIRHGRCAMLAVVGYLTTASGARLPGMESMGSGFKAFDISSMSMEVRGTLPLTLACVGLLTMAMRDVTGNSEFPGDYRNGIDFGWDTYDEPTKLYKRSVELNNGRAAQMGILGLMVHEQLGESILPGGI